MKGFLLSMIVFSTVLVTAYSIKCYVCQGTEETCSKDKLQGDDSKQMTCPGDANQCIRTWYKKDDKTTVANLCGNDEGCKNQKDACDEIKEGKCAVGCCDKDLCNAGSPFSFSLLLMVLCSALGLAQLK